MVVENIEEVRIPEFRDSVWDVSQLKEIQNQQGTELEGAPYLINLQELINFQIIDE